MSDESGVHIRGGATPDEVAVVVAVLGVPRTSEPDALGRWQKTRLAARRLDPTPRAESVRIVR